MGNEGNTALNAEPGAARFDVAVVDPDPRLRMKLVMELATVAAAASFDTLDALGERVADERPLVVVLGPGYAQPLGLEHMQRLTSGRPIVSWIVVAEELSTQLLQQAIRSGARDVLTIATADTQLRSSVNRVGAIAVGGLARPAAGAMEAQPGRVVVSFSTKGGVGKSVIATNVAVTMARRSSRPVALVDADLQFGDVAVLLGLPPEHSVVDAAAAIHHADTTLMGNLLQRHEPSGLLVLPAPVEPSAADQVRPEDMVKICEVLQQMCGTVIVDMPPHFDDLVLAMLDMADEVLLVASMDIPSIKNLKVGMQTLDLLSLAGPKLRLVLNRANAKVRLDVGEVEKALGMKVDFPVPSDIAVPQAINRGIPVVLDQPRTPVARALEAIADALLDEPPPAAPEAGSHRRRRRRKGEER